GDDLASHPQCVRVILACMDDSHRETDSLGGLLTRERFPTVGELPAATKPEECRRRNIRRVERKRTTQKADSLLEAFRRPFMQFRQRSQIKIVGVEATGR